MTRKYREIQRMKEIMTARYVKLYFLEVRLVKTSKAFSDALSELMRSLSRYLYQDSRFLNAIGKTFME
ncbi:MAG: hypothetical protein Q9170_001823 [Blastenia crenularia]